MTRQALLIVTTSFPINADGSEAAGGFVADFADAMAQHMAVRVVAPGRRVTYEENGELAIWRFNSGNKPLSQLSPAKPWHWFSIISVLRSLKRQVFAASEDGMVVHTFALWVLPSGWAARQLQKKQGIPYSVWALGSDIWSLGRIPVLRALLRRVCRDASEAYADGLGLAAEAESVCHREFKFLPSCRRLDGVRSSPVANAPPYRMLFLGRWHRNKGVDLLLDALDILEEADWGRIEEVHIAGGGPMEELVHARIGSLSRAARPVRVSGYLSRDQASAALARTDRLLLPSRVESIPVVFSDALAYCVPVIAMPVGDLPQLLDCGAVAESVTAEAFAEAIRRSCRQDGGASRSGISRLKNIFDVNASAKRVAASVSARPQR
ncbi:glycosyltransferase [Lysobacter sp. F6437]|uniref:glycosyltransferase n=1 Tax=Lysobacter sp. F6437 TaxID=3459296 RepID=UPI00403E0383